MTPIEVYEGAWNELHLREKEFSANSTLSPEGSTQSPTITSSDGGNRVRTELVQEMESEVFQTPASLARTMQQKGENYNISASTLPHGLPRSAKHTRQNGQDPNNVPFHIDPNPHSRDNVKQRRRPDLEAEDARTQQHYPNLKRVEAGDILGNVLRCSLQSGAAPHFIRDAVGEQNEIISETGQQQNLPCRPQDADMWTATQLNGKFAASHEKGSQSEQHRMEHDQFTGSQRQPLSFTGAVACICRDDLGRIIDGFTKSVEVRSAEQAEVMALLETLDFISSKLTPNRSEKEILIHSDCSTMVNGVLSTETFSWEIQPLVDRAKRKLEQVSGLTLAHCSRITNKVADWLAKAHRMGCLTRNWINNPPSALLDLLCVDASSVFANNVS